MITIIQLVIGAMITACMYAVIVWPYLILRDKIRMYYYKKGYRVFTKKEIRDWGLDEEETKVVEGEVLSKKGDVIETTGRVIDLEKEKIIKLDEKRKKKKETINKLEHFEDPMDKFKKYKM